MPRPELVVGVAGGSGSGKSTVAAVLRRRFGAADVALLAQDSYYRAIEWGPENPPSAHDFDALDAIDFDLFVTHLEELRAGRRAEVPIYDFATHRRTLDNAPLEPRPLLVVEGTLLFAVDRIRELLDLKVWVDADPDLRFIRRLRRDIAERGRSVESVVEQYLATVRPAHLAVVEPSRCHADVVIGGGGDDQEAIAALIGGVAERLSRTTRRPG